MAALLPQKKGPCRRKNQAGQGNEVDGTGRRSRSSAGSSAGKCLSARSYACGSHARRSPRATTEGPSAAKAGTGDRRHAYDSDPLRQRLQKRGIELIAPYRENRKERRFEDGRKLRRYKRRWIVERTNSWLGQFRRLLVRHEHLLSTSNRRN